MASFPAKIDWKKLRNRENKNVTFRSNPRRSRNLKKKFKKLKNTIVASFLAKICWKMQRKRENKNYRSVSFFLHA